MSIDFDGVYSGNHPFTSLYDSCTLLLKESQFLLSNYDWKLDTISSTINAITGLAEQTSVLFTTWAKLFLAGKIFQVYWVLCAVDMVVKNNYRWPKCLPVSCALWCHDKCFLKNSIRDQAKEGRRETAEQMPNTSPKLFCSALESPRTKVRNKRQT